MERLYAFNDYCRHASLWRLTSVCLFFSIPAVLTSIALELIPLQDPYAGVRDNHGAWTRLFFIALIATISLFIQINQLVPQLALSPVCILAAAFATSCCYMLIMVAIATYWIYPIPFGMVIGIPPYSTLAIVFLLAAVGRKRYQCNASLRRQLAKQIEIIVAQSLIAAIYPVFSAFMYRIPFKYKPCFVVFLPVIKFLTQQFVAWSASDLVDYQPGIVVFCVKVFNSLYSAKSLQSAGGSAQLTTLIIMAFELLEFAFVLRRLHREIVSIDRCHCHITRERRRSRAQRSSTSFSALQIKQPLLGFIMELCEQPGVLSSVVHQGAPLIRLQSSIRYSLTPDMLVSIDHITRAEYKRFCTSSYGTHITTIQRIILPHLNQIVPVNTEIVSSITKQPPPFSGKTQEMSLREKHDFVYAVLKLLFECEYYLLAQYVKCAVPLMYTVYVIIVFQLPSAQYYPETRDLSQARTMVLNLLLYAGFEVFMFLLLHALVKSRCGISPTHLLAFVLENQVLEFQGRLFLWYIFLLEFTLMHFGTVQPNKCNDSMGALTIVMRSVGVDYTLRFSWTNHSK